ncbi:hypothetical protein ACHZ98_34010 [Streptomyces sp. MAR4 CNY-716]
MRRPTHRHTAATAATLAALALAVGTAGPAAAGGPTSALVVNGGSGDAAALYATDPGYAALDKAIGDHGERLDTPLTATDLDDGDGRQVKVTWLQHDIHAWRVDTLFLDAPGGAVVSRGSGEDPGTAQTWRLVEHPERLESLLDRLGVAGRPEEQSGWYTPSQFSREAVAPGAGGGGEPGSAPASGEGADTEEGGAPGTGPAAGTAAAAGDTGARERAAAAPGPGAGTNWWWTLPGLAAGALLATAAPACAAAVRPRRHGPPPAANSWTWTPEHTPARTAPRRLPGRGTNWWWTLPGLAAGALLAAAPRLYRRRAASPAPAGSRGVLLDRDD